MKKLLTKWWFWVIVIIVIIAIISGIKDSKEEAKINGNIVSFTLTDSTFNTYPEDNIVKEVNITPDTIDSSKAYAKTRCKSGSDVDTVKSEKTIHQRMPKQVVLLLLSPTESRKDILKTQTALLSRRILQSRFPIWL